MIEWLTPLTGSFHQDADLLAQPFLADHLFERVWAQCMVDPLLATFGFGVADPFGLSLRLNFAPLTGLTSVNTSFVRHNLNPCRKFARLF